MPRQYPRSTNRCIIQSTFLAICPHHHLQKCKTISQNTAHLFRCCNSNNKVTSTAWLHSKSTLSKTSSTWWTPIHTCQKCNNSTCCKSHTRWSHHRHHRNLLICCCHRQLLIQPPLNQRSEADEPGAENARQATPARTPAATKRTPKVPIWRLICEHTQVKNHTHAHGKAVDGSSRDLTNLQGITGNTLAIAPSNAISAREPSQGVTICPCTWNATYRHEPMCKSSCLKQYCSIGIVGRRRNLFNNLTANKKLLFKVWKKQYATF